MACGKCGGGGGKKNAVPSTNAPLSSATKTAALENLVLVEYIGIQTQKRRLKSKVRPRETYTYSGDERFFRAYAGDVDWLIAKSNDFRIAKVEEVAAEVAHELAPVLKSDTREISIPIEALNIDPIITALLKRGGYMTVEQLSRTSDADILVLKGMGDARLKTVRKAVHALQE